MESERSCSTYWTPEALQSQGNRTHFDRLSAGGERLVQHQHHGLHVGLDLRLTHRSRRRGRGRGYTGRWRRICEKRCQTRFSKRRQGLRLSSTAAAAYVGVESSGDLCSGAGPKGSWAGLRHLRTDQSHVSILVTFLGLLCLSSVSNYTEVVVLNPGSTRQPGIVGNAAGRCTAASPRIVFPAGWLCSDLEMLPGTLSCSEGSSGVRGPSGGHRRTEGGRSSPAPGYLGNTRSQRDKSVFKKCQFQQRFWCEEVRRDPD